MTTDPPRELSQEAEDLVDQKMNRLLKKSKGPKNDKHPKKNKAAKKPNALKNREPQSAAESGMLSHSKEDWEAFWGRTERYCTRYTEKCVENFCSNWYPNLCEEFCERFPQWCTPDPVTEQCDLQEIFHDLQIYSKYGPNWVNQVEEVCDEVDSRTCYKLRGTVDMGYAEMSHEQLDHMWQISYSGEFDEYNPYFCEDGEFETDTDEFPLEDITGIVMTNIYVDQDPYCKPEVQQNILDPLSEIKYTMMN